MRGDFALSVGNPGTELPDGWAWTKLTDVARLETGHTPSRRVPEYWSGGDIPWVQTRDATANHGQTIYATDHSTNELGIANSAARILPTGTVCLSRTASVGYVVVMGRPMATSQDFVNWVCSDALNNQFLKYVLMAERRAILSFASGTTHQTVYFPEVKAFHVALPPPAEQRAIAHILGTLDDKIEINRRMNETLEAIARALFKSWFVDFDPVHAKAEGRETGLPAEIDALFPDSFEETELGEAPKGWEVGRVDDAFVVTMGQSPPGETYNESGDGVPFYQGRTDFGFRFPTRRVYCTAPTRLARAGDTLVSVRAPVGDVNIASEDCAIGRGVAAVRHQAGSRSYSYYFMASLTDVFAVFEAGGTVFGSIGKKEFHGISCTLPPLGVVKAFDRLVSPADRRIELNERESQTLTAARDALLPRLISGKLQVPHSQGGAHLSATGQPDVREADTFRLCFVGGVFGAGKSTLCQALARRLSARHVKASELIEFRPQSSDSTGKAVVDVRGNQERLAAAVGALRGAAEVILLDGHFCLWDSNHEMIPVPLDIFRRINPFAMVLVDADPNEVVARFTERDGRRIDPDLMLALIGAEREHAQSVADALDVPLFVMNGSASPRKLTEQLRAILGAD